MKKRLDIPIDDMLGALFHGECDEWSKLNYKTYLVKQGFNDKVRLKWLLDEVDNMINEFCEGFFVSEYDAYQHYSSRYPKVTALEYAEYLEGLKQEEAGWMQEGKKRYTLDSLYRLMDEQNLFFNEAHEIAVNNAYNEKNCKLLRYFYEEYVLRNAHEFRDCIKELLDDIPVKDVDIQGELEEIKLINMQFALKYAQELRRYIKGLQDDKTKIPVNDKGMQGEPEEKTKLTNRQIALICYYRGTPINNESKASEIFKEFGSSNKRPEKLRDRYTEMKIRTNRTGADGTKADHAKIKDFEFVIEYFKKQGDEPQDLYSDFEILKSNIENDR